MLHYTCTSCTRAYVIFFTWSCGLASPGSLLSASNDFRINLPPLAEGLGSKTRVLAVSPGRLLRRLIRWKRHVGNDFVHVDEFNKLTFFLLPPPPVIFVQSVCDLRLFTVGTIFDILHRNCFTTLKGLIKIQNLSRYIV